MVLHTIINEYDVLYAQERALTQAENVGAEEKFSTNPLDFLMETTLSAPAETVLKIKYTTM